jgi:hypothetical protein
MSGSANEPSGSRMGVLHSAWALLGVTDDADVPELTRAYRRRARGLHPDRSSDPQATQQFQALHTAYRLALDAAIHTSAPAADSSRRRDGSWPAAPEASMTARGMASSGVGASPDHRSSVGRATQGPDDGVWVVAGPVVVRPPAPTDVTRNHGEGRR